MTERTQISTTVPPWTRRQAERLCEHYGWSLREVLTLAIDHLYQRMLAGQLNQDAEDTYLERAERNYWASHPVHWTDDDRPFVAE